MKQIIRSLEPRNYIELHQAIQTAMQSITLEDIHNWFTHCCYSDAPFSLPSHSQKHTSL